MLFNEIGDDFAIGLESVNRSLFVVAHEAAVAGDVGTGDSCEFAFDKAVIGCGGYGFVKWRRSGGGGVGLRCANPIYR